MEAQLEEVIEGTKPAEPSPAKEEPVKVEVKESTKTELDEAKENMVPQSRVNEITAARREAEERVFTLEQDLSETQKSLTKMTDLLDAKSQDADILDQIRSFATDPSMQSHLEAIDKRLKGITDEIESGETTPEEGLERTRELIEAQKDEIEDLKADHQADRLLERADDTADRLLARLPEEYIDEDKNVLGELLVNNFDWQEAVNNPDNLSGQVAETLQAIIDNYGTPRGALVSREELEELKNETAIQQPKEDDPREALSTLMGKDWSKVKESDKFDPELSDDEFSRGLAQAIRLERKLDT